MQSAWLAVWVLAAAANPLTGAVKLELIGGRPVAEGVYVNGRGPYRFLIDTATTLNHMEPELARSLGLAATFRTELTSSVGRAMAAGGGGIEVALGEARAEEQRFLFAGTEVVHELAADIRGILGQEFLARFDYRIDLHARRLEFGAEERAGRRSALRLFNGRPAVSTSLGDLVLDSGTASVVLFGVRSEGASSGFLRTLAGSQIVGLVYRKLTIEGRRIWSGTAVAVEERNEPEVAGLMPLSLFRSVYFCNSAGYAVFE